MVVPSGVFFIKDKQNFLIKPTSQFALVLSFHSRLYGSRLDFFTQVLDIQRLTPASFR